LTGLKIYPAQGGVNAILDELTGFQTKQRTNLGVFDLPNA